MIDLLLTDPPYKILTKGGGVLKHSNAMKQIAENRVNNFEPSCLNLYARTNIFFHNKPLIKSYIELAEKNKKSYDLAIYKKKNHTPNYNGHLMTDIEYIAIIGKLNPVKGLPKDVYSKVYEGEKDRNNKLSYSKPVDLCKKFIKLYSNSGEVVLDLFGGSGSTLIACEELNRICYIMELEPKYCEVIIERWETLTGEKAALLFN